MKSLHDSGPKKRAVPPVGRDHPHVHRSAGAYIVDRVTGERIVEGSLRNREPAQPEIVEKGDPPPSVDVGLVEPIERLSKMAPVLDA